MPQPIPPSRPGGDARITDPSRDEGTSQPEPRRAGIGSHGSARTDALGDVLDRLCGMEHIAVAQCPCSLDDLGEATA